MNLVDLQDDLVFVVEVFLDIQGNCLACKFKVVLVVVELDLLIELAGAFVSAVLRF